MSSENKENLIPLYPDITKLKKWPDFISTISKYIQPIENSPHVSHPLHPIPYLTPQNLIEVIKNTLKDKSNPINTKALFRSIINLDCNIDELFDEFLNLVDDNQLHSIYVSCLNCKHKNAWKIAINHFSPNHTYRYEESKIDEFSAAAILDTLFRHSENSSGFDALVYFIERMEKSDIHVYSSIIKSAISFDNYKMFNYYLDNSNKDVLNFYTFIELSAMHKFEYTDLILKYYNFKIKYANPNLLRNYHCDHIHALYYQKINLNIDYSSKEVIKEMVVTINYLLDCYEAGKIEIIKEFIVELLKFLNENDPQKELTKEVFEKIDKLFPRSN
jgi:hypothetical protein